MTRLAITLAITFALSGCQHFIQSVSDCAPGQCPEAVQLAVDDILHGPFAHSR